MYFLDVFLIKFIWGDFVFLEFNEIDCSINVELFLEWILFFLFEYNIEILFYIFEKMDIDIYVMFG